MGSIFSLEDDDDDGRVDASPFWETPLKLTDLPINRSLLQPESGIDEVLPFDSAMVFFG